MKNIIPFKKDVIFKTNLSEITSISLEHTLALNKDTVEGEFIVSGEYKITDKSTTVESFEIRLPFEIVIDERYKTDKAIIDIDDFYYEIVNDNVLSISIDVLIDKLEEQPLIDLEDLTEVVPVRELINTNLDIDDESEIKNLDDNIIEDEVEMEEIIEEETCDSETKKENTDRGEKEEVEEKINSLFNQFSKNSEVFVTYNVFILREGDSIETILDKYNISEDELKKYNNLSNLQLGDKIIIPNVYERN